MHALDMLVCCNSLWVCGCVCVVYVFQGGFPVAKNVGLTQCHLFDQGPQDVQQCTLSIPQPLQSASLLFGLGLQSGTRMHPAIECTAVYLQSMTIHSITPTWINDTAVSQYASS